MEVQFNDTRFDRLETDSAYNHGLPTAVVTCYRMCLQLLRATVGEQDLCALRMLNLSSISENPLARHSVPLNDGYELVLELRPGVANRYIHIIDVAKTSPPEKEL
jgi:plasmid maintenance system killer protein